MIRTKVEVTIYEKNGDEAAFHGPKLVIESDGIYRERVVLVWGEDHLTVLAGDLEAAIERARGQ